jgi:D-glycero-D-manno-heptose 1,7-bisphosphate phosphatase
MKKLLLLDKDGTLVKPRHWDTKFVQKPWDQKLIDGVYYYLKNDYKDWHHVIISNQGGIAAGHKTLESTFLEMEYCAELLPTVKDIFFCPDFEGATCWRMWEPWDSDEYHILYDNGQDVKECDAVGQFRKPNPGMLKLAMHLFGCDEVLYVGDRPEDEGAANAANIPFMWAHDWWKS